MNWAKENYDRLLLGVTAFALAVCAALLLNNARGFNDTFNSLKDQVPRGTSIPEVNLEAVSREDALIAKPDVWKVRKVGERQLPIFVSTPYIAKADIDPSGETAYKLIDPLSEGEGTDLHPPIKNRWLIEHDQDLLAQNVATQDTDGDGFTTLDEYNGNTNPNDKDSHPPYYTKLYLKEFRRIPFRLLFAARNGNTILLNTLDLDAPTQFLKVGDLVKGTKFKVVDLQIKNDKVEGITKDTSVVTLQNTETGEKINLPKETEIDSPTTYAVISYLWAGKDFAVKKGQEFTIKPEDNVKYRCLDLNATEVTVLKLDDNKTLKIGKLPAKS